MRRRAARTQRCCPLALVRLIAHCPPAHRGDLLRVCVCVARAHGPAGPGQAIAMAPRLTSFTEAVALHDGTFITSATIKLADGLKARGAIARPVPLASQPRLASAPSPRLPRLPQVKAFQQQGPKRSAGGVVVTGRTWELAHHAPSGVRKRREAILAEGMK